MEEQNLDQSTSGESSSNAGVWPEAFNPQFFMDRAKQAMTDPLTLIGSTKAESATPRGIYISYIMILVAIPAICNFIGFAIIGQKLPFIGTYRWPFFGGLVHTVLSYAGMLGITAIAAILAEKIAPKFEGQTDFTTMLKFFAIVWTPACLSGIFSLIPAIGIISIFFALYSLYIFFKGLPLVVDIPEKSKLPYAVTTFVSMIVAGAIVMAVVNAVSPTVMPEVKNVKLPGGTSVDLNELEKGMQNLQKFFPQGAGGN